MKRIRVLIVDDHQLFREGLTRILNSQEDFEVVGEATDGEEALVATRRLRPDLILMDVGMPVCDGMEATERIKAEFPDATIVMLTVCDADEKLFEAICQGAQGYLLKSVGRQEMFDLLRGAVEGEAAITTSLAARMLVEFRRINRQAVMISEEESSLLTDRQKEVLMLVAAGATNQEAADRLGISIHTVKNHMSKILETLQVSNRREAAALARREGLIPPPGVEPA
jgi:DNA-binding NarL/FixJ family response regulator